jgi:hypothetical protein
MAYLRWDDCALGPNRVPAIFQPPIIGGRQPDRQMPISSLPSKSATPEVIMLNRCSIWLLLDH